MATPAFNPPAPLPPPSAGQSLQKVPDKTQAAGSTPHMQMEVKDGDGQISYTCKLQVSTYKPDSELLENVTASSASQAASVKQCTLSNSACLCEAAAHSIDLPDHPVPTGQLLMTCMVARYMPPATPTQKLLVMPYKEWLPAAVSDQNVHFSGTVSCSWLSCCIVHRASL